MRLWLILIILILVSCSTTTNIEDTSTGDSNILSDNSHDSNINSPLTEFCQGVKSIKECEDSSYEAERNVCYDNKIKETNNPKLCCVVNEINCFDQIAKDYKNEEFCELIKYFDSPAAKRQAEYCLLELVTDKIKEDIQVCDRLTEADFLEECYLYLGLTTKNNEACNKIEDNDQKNFCLGRANEDPSYCDSIQEWTVGTTSGSDYCKYQIAIYSNMPELCENLPSALKTNCFQAATKDN